MDSKRMRRALIAMILVFVAVIAAIAIANLDTVKRKLGLAQETPVQEEQKENTDTEETESGQIGSNLSAFLSDETFLIRR